MFAISSNSAIASPSSPPTRAPRPCFGSHIGLQTRAHRHRARCCRARHRQAPRHQRRELHAQYPRDACCSRNPPLPHRSRHTMHARRLPDPLLLLASHRLRSLLRPFLIFPDCVRFWADCTVPGSAGYSRRRRWGSSNAGRWCGWSSWRRPGCGACDGFAASVCRCASPTASAPAFRTLLWICLKGEMLNVYARAAQRRKLR